MDKTPSIKPSISNDYFKDRLDEIKKYYEPIDEDDLYIRENPNNVLINFIHFLFHDITNKILEYAKYKQKVSKNRIEDLKDYNIPNSEKYKIDKTENLYDSRNYVIKMFDDYNLMQKGEGLKILTPNQMLKRLPIALAQIKGGNNLESLLKEIRQIVYSFYRSKKLLKKYTTT